MANDFTVADVLEWARTKPADEAYDFIDPKRCAVAQFGLATCRDYLFDIGDIGKYSIPLRQAVVGSGDDSDWTFGELVTRLEALVQETPAKPSLWLNPETYLAADCGRLPA